MMGSDFIDWTPPGGFGDNEEWFRENFPTESESTPFPPTLPRDLEAAPDETAASVDGITPLRLVRLAEIQMRSIEWLDKPFIQRSAFHLVVGPKGVGKGTWIAGVIARVTQGIYGKNRNVIVVHGSEDSAAIDVKPRAVAAGADSDRICIPGEHFTLPDDLDRLHLAALDLGNVGLVVIDPISGHIGRADTDREGAVRFAIGGLNRLADQIVCPIFGVRHVAKNRQNGALAAVLGSTAWVDVPRAVLAFAPDDEDEMKFHVQVVAGNRSGRHTAEAFRIELADVGLKEPVTKCVALGESLKDVDDLLSAPRRTSKSETARELILEILDSEGPQESDALDARIAERTGVSAKTAQNQRNELKNLGLVRNVPEKDEHGKVTRWMVSRTSAPRGPK